MWQDPIVEEIHRHRQEYAAKFNYDLHAICEDLRSRQGKDGREVVSLPPTQVSRPTEAREEPAA